MIWFNRGEPGAAFDWTAEFDRHDEALPAIFLAGLGLPRYPLQRMSVKRVNRPPFYAFAAARSIATPASRLSLSR